MSLERTDGIFMMDLVRLGGGLRSTSVFLHLLVVLFICVLLMMLNSVKQQRRQ